MATTSFQGVTRSYGGGKKKNVAPGVLTMAVQCCAVSGAGALVPLKVGRDPAVGVNFVLPKGAVPLSLVGTAAVGDGFFTTISIATIGTTSTPLGALVGSEGIAADVQVTMSDIATPSGTAELVFTYTVADNGKDGSIQ